MPWNLIIPALTSLVGMFAGGNGGSQSAQMQNLMTPEMREMLQMQLSRMRQQEPLYGDVMGMARSLLPTRYRTGRPMTSASRVEPGAGGTAAGRKPGGVPGGPGDGFGQRDTTDPYNGWQPPRY